MPSSSIISAKIHSGFANQCRFGFSGRHELRTSRLVSQIDSIWCYFLFTPNAFHTDFSGFNLQLGAPFSRCPIRLRHWTLFNFNSMIELIINYY